MRAPALARKIADLTLVKKAQDVVIMDLRGLTSMADFFVLCSADSDSQAKAIADSVEEGLEKRGTAPWHKESGSVNWILLDYVDVVLHVFHRSTRSFYNLEKLWGDAVIEQVADEAPSPRARAKGRSPRATAGSRRKLASS